MDGVALRWSDLPLELVERHKLSERMHERGGEREIRFLYRDPVPVLPVFHEGRLQIARWGNRGGKRNRLPRGGWIKLAAVETGEWAESRAVLAEVPAVAGLVRGVWFSIRQGVRCLLANADREPVVFVLVEPATHYFEVMTRSAWAPVLIGERI